jgi:hypothetical protein
MAFIGNQPFTAAFLVDTFSGTGSQTAYTMTVAPANTSSIIVAVTGVLQDPSTYSVSGTTLTFSAAPPSGTSNISVRYLGIPASGVTTTAYRTVTDFTATAGQTSFSVPSYTVGYIDVYRNGVRLVSTDYTATTGTTVVLANACTSGDAVVTESFLVSSVLNAIPATAGAVSNSYLAALSTITTSTGGTITVPTSTGTMFTTADVATQANQETATSTTTLVTPGRQQFHPSAAKGWVKADSAGSSSASFNVSSITDGGVGRVVVNWIVPFSSANYVSQGTAQKNTSLTATTTLIAQERTDTTASACQMDIIDSNGTAFQDPNYTNITAWGDQ